MNSFTIVGGDTDSIMFCKPDGGPFSEEEQKSLLADLNSLYPKQIHWEHDGVYPRVLVLKAKNYVLDDGAKIKIKGSALKATLKEPALREFIDRAAKSLLCGENNLLGLYNSYVREIMVVEDITRWAFKKTMTETVQRSGRTNETKVMDAVLGEEYATGDKLFFYFTTTESLKLSSQWNIKAPDHCPFRLLKKLHDTVYVFETVVDIKQFPNYSLKRNQLALKQLTSSQP